MSTILKSSVNALPPIFENIPVIYEDDEFEEILMTRKLGAPQITDAECTRKGELSRYALLGLGKLGGQEMSYHSDLDLVLRTVRDTLTEDVEKLVVDSKSEYERVLKFVAAFMP